MTPLEAHYLIAAFTLVLLMVWVVRPSLKVELTLSHSCPNGV